jgi:hypothetical protein
MNTARPTIRLALNERIPESRIASLESRLGIGIGVSLGFLVITTEKLPEGRPYLVANLNRAEASDRAAGANAARLVKRMPLNDLTAV